jgi:hypothetical protein
MMARNVSKIGNCLNVASPFVNPSALNAFKYEENLATRDKGASPNHVPSDPANFPHH